MKASTLNKSTWLLAAIFASLVCLAYPQKSLAADTKVECIASEVVEVATGGGVTPTPFVVIDCTGGSSAGFHYYAYPLAPPPGFAFNANFANSIPTLVGFYVREFGPGATITLYSDLSNTSGNNWGCGAPPTAASWTNSLDTERAGEPSFPLSGAPPEQNRTGGA